MHVNEKKSHSFIANYFQKGTTTVRTILKNKDMILKRYFAAPTASISSSYSRDIVMINTEKALFEWIQKTEWQIWPPCGQTLIEKAKELHMSFSEQNPEETVKPFNASGGWLYSFKKRFNLINTKTSFQENEVEDTISSGIY